MNDMDELLDDDTPMPKSKPEPVTDELMAEVERELSAFDAFFQSPVSDGGCGNEPLVPMEMALLRTYLVARKTRRFPSVLEL